MESELNVKYLSMKREMAQQMNDMKLEMMLQMDEFSALHRKSVSEGTAELDAEQPRERANHPCERPSCRRRMRCR